MQHVKNFKDSSLIFERAFTQYAYTTATITTMFSQKDLISDQACNIKSFDKTNSPLINLLEENDYQIRIFMNCNRVVMFEPSNHVYSKRYETISQIMFAALTELAEQDNNYMFYMHFMETHAPYHCGYSQTMILKAIPKFFISGRMQFALMKAKKYVDNVFGYFNKFIPDTNTKIVMSDHGGGRTNCKLMEMSDVMFEPIDIMYMESRIVFIVSSPYMPKRINRQFFSIKDLTEIVKRIILEKDMEIKTDYVKLQWLPMYNDETINWYLNTYSTLPLPRLGIISSDGMYTIDYNGNEEFFPNTHENCISNPTYTPLINKMRVLCGNDFKNLFDQPKFAYAKKVYLEKGLIKE